jgi:aminobenzoyl-glutamate utilization protein B
MGPPAFDAADQEFARALQKEVAAEPAGLATRVVPYAPKTGGTASSDIGEVSAVVPLAELGVATRPLGTAAHQWAQTSCAAHPVGMRGMMVAAKVLAASGVDLLADPKLVGAAKEEFKAQTKGKAYVSPLAPDARPPVARADARHPEH